MINRLVHLIILMALEPKGMYYPGYTVIEVAFMDPFSHQVQLRVPAVQVPSPRRRGVPLVQLGGFAERRAAHDPPQAHEASTAGRFSSGGKEVKCRIE